MSRSCGGGDDGSTKHDLTSTRACCVDLWVASEEQASHLQSTSTLVSAPRNRPKDNKGVFMNHNLLGVKDQRRELMMLGSRNVTATRELL